MVSVLLSLLDSVPSSWQERKPKCCTEVAAARIKRSSAPIPRGLI